MGELELRSFDSAAAFLEVAEEHLAAREAVNSLPLGLALRAREGSHGPDGGTRFLTVTRDGGLDGVLIQTPGRVVIFGEMSPEGARFAAREAPGHVDVQRGCTGPVEVVDVVAEVWGELDLGRPRAHMGLRLFELSELVPPRLSSGRMRLAGPDDRELCRRWIHDFLVECRMPEATPGRYPERVHQLEERRLYLWEDEGRPVACAAWARPLRRGVTIGFVFTPPEARGRGYASNVVAGLTAGLLDGSLFQPARDYVTLFTDLANPTSNAIYQRLGYQPLADFRTYVLEAVDS